MNKREEKKKLRESILAKRNELSPEYRQIASEKIIKKVLELEDFRNARTVMSFVSFGTEVSTRKFIEKCWQLGKRVVVPLAIIKTKELIVYEISNWQQLEAGVYGILEPIPVKERQVDAREIDFVLNPGVVFGEDLNRVGYGGGFYDRFYHLLNKECKRVAVGFDIQLVKEVPTNQYDIPVDMLITEKRTIDKAD